MITLDMRGQPCPIPVVNAKKALAKGHGESVTVFVDNLTAVQNLEKMALGSGYSFFYVEEGASYYRTLIGKPVDGAKAAPEAQRSTDSEGVQAEQLPGGLVILITADSMGRGEDELGRLLVKGFIFSLTELNVAPRAVLFLNSGARLTTEGANTIPDLKTLESKGVKVATCGTCLNYYKIADKLAAGSVIDMMTITNLLANASNIITI